MNNRWLFPFVTSPRSPSFLHTYISSATWWFKVDKMKIKARKFFTTNANNYLRAQDISTKAAVIKVCLGCLFLRCIKLQQISILRFQLFSLSELNFLWRA